MLETEGNDYGRRKERDFLDTEGKESEIRDGRWMESEDIGERRGERFGYDLNK